jgi:hypothetical protein
MSIRERSTACGLTRLTAVIAFALLALWPSQALAAEASTFDLQAAINACPAGGSVTIPAGTFTMSSQVVLKSGITLQGAGVGQTILAMPAQSAQTNLLAGVNVSDVGIKDLTLSSPAASGKVLAIHLSSYSGVTIERVYVTGCEYALKADTQGSTLTVRDFTARACGQVYISNLTGGLFERLDVEVVTEPLYDVDFSALYLCAGNHDLRFSDFRARGGSGWTIQLWSDYGPAQASSNIEFDGLDVAGWGPLALGYDFSNVRVSNAVFGGGTERPCIRLYGLSDVLIDSFSGSGGTQLLQSWGGTNSNVTLANGTYTGSTLVDQANGSISNLVIQNVSQGVTTATTLSAIPATTLAPSTTTSAAPTPTYAAPESTVTSATSTTSAPSTTTTTLAPLAVTTNTSAPIASSVAKAPALAPTTLVAITGPVEWGTVYRGRVPVRVDVSSTQRIAKVVCYLDGRRVGRDYRAPYRFSWNARKVARGSVHTLTVIAYSRQGLELGRSSHRVVIAAR